MIFFQSNYRQNETPTLFIHGFMGNHTDWDEVIQHRKLNAITLDLPGHGTNTDMNYHDINHYSQMLIKELSATKYNLVGYSMGGRVAFHLFLLAPQLFNRITIISANPYCPNPLERLNSDKKIFSDYNKTFFSKWYNLSLFGNISNHPNFSTFLIKRSNNNIDQLQKSLNILTVAKQKDLRKDLAQFQQKFSYISGELDKKYTLIGHELKTLSPFISHTIALNCGHNVIFEQPQLISDLL